MIGDKAKQYYILANTKFESGLIEGAVQALDKAIQIQPNYIDALSLRASIYFHNTGGDGILHAFRDYSTILEYYPNNVNALLNRGAISVSVWPEDVRGVEDLELAGKLDPDNFPHYNIAMARFSLKDFQGVVDHLEPVVRSRDTEDTQLAHSSYFLGVSYLKLGRLHESVNSFKTALDLRVEYNLQYLYSNLAEAYFQLEKYDEVLINLRKCVMLDHELAGIYGDYIGKLMRGSNYQLAQRFLDEALKNDIKDSNALKLVYKYLMNNNDLRTAIKYIHPVLEVETENFEGYANLGTCYYSIGDEETAIKYLSTSIDKGADQGFVYFIRGMCYYNLNNSDCCSDWRKAVSLGYSHAQKFLDEKCFTTRQVILDSGIKIDI